MERQIYKFDLIGFYKANYGSVDTSAFLELCNIEYPKVKEFWKNEDKTKYPFAEYTSSLINELQSIIRSKDETKATFRTTAILTQLSDLHFEKKLELSQVFNWCPNNQRVQTLYNYMDYLSDEMYWEQLAESYTSQEYYSVPYQVLVQLFSMNRNHKDCLMNEEEHKLLKSLPEFVSIYRGMSKREESRGHFRLSWTLDKKIAQKFVERNEYIYKDEMIIKELQVPKMNIVAIFLGRKEQEVIYINKKDLAFG